MNEKWKQKLHIEPPKGWLNDPNGLIFFKGKYHVFFQYSPDSAYGKGRKCWGHYESTDLINWRFTGTVLFPDTAEDKDGVYSGCAIADGDNIRIFYTGNVKEDGNFDFVTSGRGANVISVSTSDGTIMSEKNILLRNSDYPEYCSCHVRDPKVWIEDNCYKMVLGARTLQDKGAVLFYTSENLNDWKFEKKLSLENFGYMWECPDCFEINGYKYLSISPQGLTAEEYRFQNVYSSGYFKFNNNELSDFKEWDFGFDFYAPQTFKAPDGRRILIGWMGIGDVPYTNPTAKLGWQHCLTLSREIIRNENGELFQRPVKELENLRYDRVTINDGEIKELKLPFDLTAKCKEVFTLDMEYLKIHFENNIIKIEFTNKDAGFGRKIRKTILEKCDTIRVIADMSSMEIYADGGRAVLSTRFYPKDERLKISAINLNCEVYLMKEMGVSFDGS